MPGHNGASVDVPAVLRVCLEEAANQDDTRHAGTGHVPLFGSMPRLHVRDIWLCCALACISLLLLTRRTGSISVNTLNFVECVLRTDCDMLTDCDLEC